MIDVRKIIMYIKLYWQDPTHWSSARGSLNLMIILQTFVGVWFMHNTFNLQDAPNWITLVLSAYVLVKFVLFVAYVINVTRSEYHMGICVGGTVILAVHSLCMSIFWRRSMECHNHRTDQLNISQVCHKDYVSAMTTAYYGIVILFSSQVILGYLLTRHKDFICSGQIEYMNLPQETNNDFDEVSNEDYGLSSTFGGSGINVLLPPGPGSESKSKMQVPRPM